MEEYINKFNKLCQIVQYGQKEPNIAINQTEIKVRIPKDIFFKELAHSTVIISTAGIRLDYRNTYYSHIYFYDLAKDDLIKFYQLIKTASEKQNQNHYERIFYQKSLEETGQYLKEEYPYEDGEWLHSNDRLKSTKEELITIKAQIEALIKRIE